MLWVGEVDEDELYRALDVLGAAQPAIEKALARRHLKDGMTHRLTRTGLN